MFNIIVGWTDSLCCLNFAEAWTLKGDKYSMVHLGSSNDDFIGCDVPQVIIFTPADAHSGFDMFELSYKMQAGMPCVFCFFTKKKL